MPATSQPSLRAFADDFATPAIFQASMLGERFARRWREILSDARRNIAAGIRDKLESMVRGRELVRAEQA